MPIGRGLPTRKVAPGKSSVTGSRRRNRGLPLASGGATGNSTAAAVSSSSSSAAANGPRGSSSSTRPSTIPSSSTAPSAPTSRRNQQSASASAPSSSSKKKKKASGKNGSSNSNSNSTSTSTSNSKSNAAADKSGTVKTEAALRSPSLKSSASASAKRPPRLLEAKFDKIGTLKINGGTRNGSSNNWKIKVIVNGKPFDPKKGIVSSSSSAGTNNSTSNFSIQRNRQQQDQQQQYRPRRYRSITNDDTTEDAADMLGDEEDDSKIPVVDRISSSSAASASASTTTSTGAAKSALTKQGQAAPLTKRIKGKDGNFHFCKVCKEVGNVVCCDGCPHVYHPQCLPEDCDSFAALDTQNDDDPWFCPECTEQQQQQTSGKTKKKKKKKGSGGSKSPTTSPSTVNNGNKILSPYRQQRPKRKCSYDADDLMNKDGDHDEMLVDEDGDPVAVAVNEDDISDEEETEISEATLASPLKTPSKGSSSHHRSNSPKSATTPSGSGKTPKKSAAGVLSSGKKKSKNKKQKTGSGSGSGNRSNSPVHPRATSPPTIPKSEPSAKKKDKKKKKKKKKEHSEDGDSGNSGGSDDAHNSGDNDNNNDNNSNSDDDGGMFAHLLSNISSGLVKAVPAFYFFLNENRNKIDRNLSRKHRYFNRLPKANMERNQLIAKEGIVMWSKLTDVEVKRYIGISMKDFERRIIEWKEEKNLRNMMTVNDADEGTTSEQNVNGVGVESDVTSDLLQEDDRLTHENHQRLYLATTVGSKPYKPDLEESNNRILLELLQDTRFHPLPMMQANRSAREYGEMDFDRITIPYFDVNGPISTCLGDECLGCARGWTHFCNVLKRRVPAVARRAKLQPPLSSLVATRVGLGLKNPQLAEDNEDVDENGIEKKSGTSSNVNGGIKKSSDSNVETFTSRDIPSAVAAKALPHYPWEALTSPTERADDIVRFVEEAVCMKIPEPPRPGDDNSDSNVIAENNDTSANSTNIISLNVPIRGRKRQVDELGGVVVEEDDEEIIVNKCGRCRTIIEGDTGCVPCRRAQLVINMSRGEGQTDENVSSKVLRVQTNMLGRIVMRDGEVESQEDGDEAVSNHILRQRWTPFAILPPQTLTSPIPTAVDGSVVDDEDEDEYDEGEGEGEGDEDEDAEESISAGEDGTDAMELNSDTDIDAANAVSDDPMVTEEESSTLASNNEDDVDVQEPASKRLRASSRIVALESNSTTSNTPSLKEIDANDRHLLAKKFKEEASAVQKKCLSIACYGLLLALTRRDPLLHFAEPVEAEGYYDIIHEPMDFGKIKKNLLRNKYATLGSFVSDARLLCNNAMAFNPPDSIYWKTAKELSDVLTVMQKRASEWITTMKDAHASTFKYVFDSSRKPQLDVNNNENGEDDEKAANPNSYLGGGDPFQRLREEWPEAVEMFEEKEWLQKAVETDFMRTKENESAYYGSLAIRRAAVAAAVSLAPYTDSGGIFNTVGRRTYQEDEKLRTFVAEKVAEAVTPPELKEIPSWREEMIMRVLRKSQARRMEGRMGSTHGCARCDGVRVDPESNKAINAVTVRWGRTRKKPNEVPRIHKSRLGLSTGLGSQNTQDRIKRHKTSDIRKGLRKGKIAALVAAADKVNEVAVTARGSRIHGMGLFADQALQKGDVVAEYVGEYVSPAVTDAREKVYQNERIQDYQFRIDSQLVIDATKRGGHGRYANHNCDPNCATKIIPFKVVTTTVSSLLNNNNNNNSSSAAAAAAEIKSSSSSSNNNTNKNNKKKNNNKNSSKINGNKNSNDKNSNGSTSTSSSSTTTTTTTTTTTSTTSILKRVVIVAQRDIEPMEELTYDYQFPLEIDLDERIPCNCNSELCRGFMNWDLPEKGAKNQIFRTQKRGANMRDRIRRLGRPLKGDK